MEPDRKTVLCIGNDPIPLNLRCGLLKEEGWRVLSAGTGHEGVRRLGQVPVDAAVLDLGNAAESALIAGELKRLHPGLSLVMIVDQRETPLEDATAQADAVVTKANEVERLLEIMRQLRRSALRPSQPQK
jgi:CheY-like chemotaxis protein